MQSLSTQSGEGKQRNSWGTLKICWGVGQSEEKRQSLIIVGMFKAQPVWTANWQRLSKVKMHIPLTQ